MELNRETAMRIWNQRYGRQIAVNDFAGRKIVKSAYEDDMSQYCWSLGHILPPEQGGANINYNLICCHKLTLTEKGDHFPLFSANGENYEIVRVMNHYEIHLHEKNDEQAVTIIKEDNEGINLLDKDNALNLLKDISRKLDEERFMSVIQISLTNITNLEVHEFIKELFNQDNVIFSPLSSQYRNDIVIADYDLFSKSDVSNLLDKCVLLNTYLSNYFVPKGDIITYSIYFTVKHFEKGKDMFYHIDFDELKRLALLPGKSTVYIDSEAAMNSKAQNYINRLTPAVIGYKKFYEYNFIFKNLADQLKAELAKETKK